MTAHHVEAFLDDDGMNGWQCFTCGAECTGLRGWALAEKLGNIHARAHLNRPPAPPLSPEEREIVDRFENAPNGLSDVHSTRCACPDCNPEECGQKHPLLGHFCQEDIGHDGPHIDHEDAVALAGGCLMAARVCDECGAWVLLPHVPEDRIGDRPVRWPHHSRGKARNAPPCPRGGDLLRVWAVPEQREGTA